VAVYLDSSALVKLVVREPESAALRRYLRRHPTRVSCALARVEVVRAVRAQGTSAAARARALLGRMHILRIDDSLLEVAADLDPLVMRSLDAVHLAAAQMLGSDLDALVTYDLRMRRAATDLGFRTVSNPGDQR
jgi:uncharacterized protein